MLCSNELSTLYRAKRQSTIEAKWCWFVFSYHAPQKHGRISKKVTALRRSAYDKFRGAYCSRTVLRRDCRRIVGFQGALVNSACRQFSLCLQNKCFVKIIPLFLPKVFINLYGKCVSKLLRLTNPFLLDLFSNVSINLFEPSERYW